MFSPKSLNETLLPDESNQHGVSFVCADLFSRQSYLLYAQAVLQLSFSDQIYSGVQGPLVLAGKDDVGSIEPGHLGHFVIHITPAGTTGAERLGGKEIEIKRHGFS